MTQNPTGGRDPEADLNMGQGPAAIPGGRGADGADDEGTDGDEGAADSGADQPAVPGEHDDGADGGADISR